MPGTQVFPREPDSVTNPKESFARNALGSVIDGTRQKILVFANSSIDVVGDRDYYRLEFDRIFFGAHCRRAAESHRNWSGLAHNISITIPLPFGRGEKSP